MVASTGAIVVPTGRFSVIALSEELLDEHRVQRRALRRDSSRTEPMCIQDVLEASKEPLYVLMGRVVIRNLTDQPPERAIVHNGQNAEGTIIEFVGSDVTGKVRRHLVKMILGDACGRLFPPGLHPFLDGDEGNQDSL